MIRAFNKDTPYNVFLAEQIAGDELDRVTDDSLIATGFLRSYAKVGFREKDNPQFRYEYLDDMIATHRPRRSGADGAMRALPQSQVRSDLAEGLLPACRRRCSAMSRWTIRWRRRRKPRRYGRRLADDRREHRSRCSRRSAQLEEPYRQELAAGEIQEVSRERAARHRTSRSASARRARRCWPNQ